MGDCRKDTADPRFSVADGLAKTNSSSRTGPAMIVPREWIGGVAAGKKGEERGNWNKQAMWRDPDRKKKTVTDRR